MRLIERYMDPTDALMEYLFGLIMVLTFTLGAGIVIEEGPDATRQLLLAVLGCNLAWGVIDAAMSAMSVMLERSRRSSLISELNRNPDRDAGLELIAGRLEADLGPITSAADRQVPFLLVDDRFVALRASNALLLIALFAAGFRWGRVTNGNPWIVGGGLLLSGLVLVAVAIALGG